MLRQNDGMGQFAKQIITWQQQSGRHDLPWQNTRDPYQIWVSEIMLQQTQVNAVIGYYAKFMARFPDVATLAAAPLDDVMQHWAGLGYYARARNLHKSAVMIMAHFGGVFPGTFDEVLSLPGIGRSTAAAICAFAYGQRGAILDGNVKRVLARRFGVTGDVRSKLIEEQLWQVAEREVPNNDIEAYTQGLMDLGATVCTRGQPSCLLCPLRRQCVAFNDGMIDQLPGRGARKETPHRQTRMLVMLHANSVLIERRPPTGIWGGLWSLPEIAMESDVLAVAKSKFGITPSKGRRPRPLAEIEHGFTHYSLTIYPTEIAVAKRELSAEEPGILWLDLADISTAALPAPVKKILLALEHKAKTKK
jgi:A/G-specific adenine glycosylase